MVIAQRQHTTSVAPCEEAGWPAGFTIEAYGVRIALRASLASALDGLHRTVPPGARVTDGGGVDALFSVLLASTPGQHHRLYENAACVAHTANVDGLFETLESRLHFMLAVLARTRLFVHAGVVGWCGGALLIPGRTMSGKSSLVAALVQLGATYLSDEYAVMDDQGFVHPFARPLGIRDEHGRTRQVAPVSLGARVGEEALPVRSVVVTRFVPGATWSPRPLSGGAAVLSLLENTVAARRRPADALRILCVASDRATAVRSERGDAASVARQILYNCTTP